MRQEDGGPGVAVPVPAIPASSVALIFDQKARLLILKPTYKTVWTIPGCVMEAVRETPWEAFVPEGREEGVLAVQDGLAALCCLRGPPLRPHGGKRVPSER